MKGKIVKLEYDAIKDNAIFIAECNYEDFFKLQDLWSLYKQGNIEIDFNPTKYKCNCANDTIDSLCYGYKILDDNINIGLPENVKMDWGKWFNIMRERYGNEPKTKNEVIFNEPATILYKDGEKYICKCDKEDKFNEELGLALCLLKSFGVSYSDFKELLMGAKRQKGRNNGKN